MPGRCSPFLHHRYIVSVQHLKRIIPIVSMLQNEGVSERFAVRTVAPLLVKVST